MKFANLEVNRNNYLKKIELLLLDPECKIIIDTNILAKFYKFYPLARKDLFRLFNKYKKDNRLIIPYWVVHEYNQKVKSNNLKVYSSIINSQTLQNQLDLLAEQFNFFIDDKHAKNKGLKNREEFLKTFHDAYEKLRPLLSLNNDAKSFPLIHAQIQKSFESSVLNSDVFNTLHRIHKNAYIRQENRIAPGFKDKENKDDNYFGDLIVWEEILEVCKKNGIKKVLFITDDRKKNDITYIPNMVINTKGKKQKNENPVIRLPHSELLHEYYLNTNSKEFYVIDFTQFAFTLNQTPLSAKYKNLILSSQFPPEISEEEYQKSHELNDISPTEPEAINKMDTEISNDFLVTEATPPSIESMPSDSEEISEEEYQTSQELNNISPIEPETINQTEVTPLFIESIPSDSEYVADITEIGSIIQNLRSYDWYIQNPTITKVSKLLQSQNSISTNDLFTLGRNIYQAACGNAFYAIEFIQQFRNKIKYQNQLNQNILFAGMLFEIYFNSNNEFRKTLKTNAFSYLKPFLNDYKQAVIFITNKLDIYKDFVLLLPVEYTQKHQFEIRFVIDASKKELELIEYSMKNTETGRDAFNEDIIHNIFKNLWNPFSISSLLQFIEKTYLVDSTEIKLVLEDANEVHIPKGSENAQIKLSEDFISKYKLADEDEFLL